MKKIFISIIFLGICFSILSADYSDFINEGIILLNQQKIAESIKLFEKARDLKPSESYPYYYLGEAYYAIGKKKEALDNYNKAIEIDNNNPYFHYSLANFYISEGNYEEAIKSLDRVIEIAPYSKTGKSAKKLKEEILMKQADSEMVQKWAKMEEELKKQKEEQKVEKTGSPEGTPPEFAGMVPGMEQEIKKEKVPVEQMIKRIKFGIESVRQNSSALLLMYEQSELLKVVADIIEIAKQSNEPAVKKNVIMALGKTGTPEAIETTLKIIQDKNELYDIKITALDSISMLRGENITTTLRNTLKSMVDNREKERTEAQKNIKDITAKLETLETQRIALNMQITQEEQKRNEIQQKLQMSEVPPEFGAPPGVPQAGGAKNLSIQEIQKIRTELLKAEASFNKKKEDLASIEKQITELQQQKARYESLLQIKGQKRTDITIAGRSTTSPPVAPPGGMPGPEFGMFPGGMPGIETPQYEETSEDKNEVIFALKLMRTLGSMRDRQGLPIIKKGWDEYGTENEKIYYFLTLARLGDFSGIQTLVERIRQDYPQTDQTGLANEIDLRSGILEVLGEYLVQNPDPKLQGLIEFLSEEGEYPEIKGAASSALISLTKTTGK